MKIKSYADCMAVPKPKPMPDQRALIYIEEMRNISEIANGQRYLCDSTQGTKGVIRSSLIYVEG